MSAARARGAPLEQMTVRMAVLVGLAQCLALWPGTSRSMVTILAALAVGLSVDAAVEFSFLLGLVTLGAATAYDGLRHGKEMLDTFGIVAPVVGFIFAFRRRDHCGAVARHLPTPPRPRDLWLVSHRHRRARARPPRDARDLTGTRWFGFDGSLP